MGYWNFMPGAHGFKSAKTYDLSGHGNHGTLTNMVPADDWTARGLHFDGVNDYVDVGDDASLDITGTGISITAWINTNDISLNYQMIVTKRYGSVNTNYQLDLRGTRIRHGDVLFGFDDPINSWVFWRTDSAQISNDTWYHVAATYDESNDAIIYVNGQSKAVTRSGTIQALPTNSEPVRIGTYKEYVTYYDFFDGLIDEVRIYNRSLSASEVIEDYIDPFRLSRRPTRRIFVPAAPTVKPWWYYDRRLKGAA